MWDLGKKCNDCGKCETLAGKLEEFLQEWGDNEDFRDAGNMSINLAISMMATNPDIPADFAILFITHREVFSTLLLQTYSVGYYYGKVGHDGGRVQCAGGNKEDDVEGGGT